MTGRFDGRVAIVTGAGRFNGLGEAMARRLASEGASIVLTDKGTLDGERFPAHGIGTGEEMERVAASIRAQTGASVRTQSCDVRLEDEVAAMVANTVEAFGRVDFLVNNAGIGYLMTLIVDTPVDDWDAVLGVNLKGMFLCTKHVARHLLAQGQGGRIVNIGVAGIEKRIRERQRLHVVEARRGRFHPLSCVGAGAARHHGERHLSEPRDHRPRRVAELALLRARWQVRRRVPRHNESAHTDRSNRDAGRHRRRLCVPLLV